MRERPRPANAAPPNRPAPRPSPTGNQGGPARRRTKPMAGQRREANEEAGGRRGSEPAGAEPARAYRAGPGRARRPRALPARRHVIAVDPAQPDRVRADGGRGEPPFSRAGALAFGFVFAPCLALVKVRGPIGGRPALCGMARLGRAARRR